MSKKIFQRTIAKNLVHDTGDTIKLLNKYEPIPKDVSYKTLIHTTQRNLERNPEFAKDYTQLLAKRNRISDYNQDHHSFIGELASLADSVVGAFTSKTDSAQTNTQTVMAMIAQEEAIKVETAKQDNMLNISAIIGMVVITGLIIYMKK